MVGRSKTIAATILVVLGATMSSGVRVHASDPAILVVTNTAGDRSPGSLRAAMEAANSDGVPSTVIFNIPTTDPGFNGRWFTIKPVPTKPLDPALLTAQTEGGTTVDGGSQTAFTGDTNPLGPEIFLDFSDSNSGVHPPISLWSDGNVIRGLAVRGTPGIAIAVWGSHNVVEGNYIGTDPTGQTALGSGIGIFVTTRTCPNACSPGVVETFPTASANVIRGNVISGNGVGILIESAEDNVVQRNLIGTDATGTAALGNSDGVVLNGTSNLVGGTTAAARNVISGNGFGVFLGLASVDNIVQGNYIGTDVAGSLAIPNDVGINFKLRFLPPTGNVIGGSVLGAGNLISGNRSDGIALAGTQNVIEGNRIGTDAAGSGPLPNGGAGVTDGFACSLGSPSPGCPGNVIGPANTIAFNRGPGIRIGNGTEAVWITRNSIFANAGLGIDLAGAGVTPNDPGDLVWPLNFPVLGTAEVADGSVTITGALDTQSPATAAVELFGNDDADPSGYGEGQRYRVSVSPASNGCFSVTFPAAAADRFFTGTATSASFGTSEFSRAIPQGTTKAAIALAPTTATNVVGTTHTVTAALTNTAGGPVPCATVAFTVTGANTASGTATTDINGTTSFTYTGVWAGEDTITATSGPATGTATKTWTFPPSTAGGVIGGGQVATPTSRASFGLTASGPTGQLEFNEKAGRNVHSTRIAATVITGTHATVYGFATVNGAGDVQFRVDADDLGEPGTNDVFRVVMRDGYTAGGVLQNGNIQIH